MIDLPTSTPRALAPVPTLDEIARDPALACALPADAAEALLGKCIGVQGALYGRLLAARAEVSRADAAEDRLLDIDEAAARFGLSRDWLYRRSRKLPFVVRVGGRLRFSSRGIERWIRDHRA